MQLNLGINTAYVSQQNQDRVNGRETVLGLAPDTPGATITDAVAYAARTWSLANALTLAAGLTNARADLPAQPDRQDQALLDFLALRFQNELGWSLKKLLREVVLSATYRQDARVDKKISERDPRNRLLAHGPRTRLSAEMVRDNALAVSGLLSDKMFGPPVMPLQPDGIWNVIYSKDEWRTPSGEDAHRRALYTFIRRTTGYPSTLTFDQPSREVCVTRRLRTNTPLQALVTLNDPVYVECAVALAARMQREGGKDLRKQIARGCELADGVAPEKKTVAVLVELHDEALKRYETHPDLAKKLATTPAAAALVLVANAILNLDSTLTK